MIPSAWLLRLSPRRSVPLLEGLAISLGALGASVILRGLLLGVGNAGGLSASVFPALIVATLYAGVRWGWATLVLATAIGIASGFNFPSGLSFWGVLLLFELSALLTVLVSGSLREVLLRLEDTSVAHEAARRASADSEARFRLLADSAPILMWVTRPDGRREFANRAYVDFLATDYEAAIGFDW